MSRSVYRNLPWDPLTPTLQDELCCQASCTLLGFENDFAARHWMVPEYVTVSCLAQLITVGSNPSRSSFIRETGDCGHKQQPIFVEVELSGCDPPSRQTPISSLRINIRISPFQVFQKSVAARRKVRMLALRPSGLKCALRLCFYV